MSELGSWQLVGKTDLGNSSIVRDVEERNFYIVPATLSRRAPIRVPGREFMDVTIEWPTSDETFDVGVDGDMAFQSGDRLSVLLTTLSSTSMGCLNGYAAVEALERAPGEWSQNTKN